MVYLYKVKIDGPSYSPTGGHTFTVVASGVSEAMNAAVNAYVEKYDYVDNSAVVNVERGAKIDAVGA